VVTAAHCVDGWVDVTYTKRLDVPVRCDPTEYFVRWESELCKMYSLYKSNFNCINESVHNSSYFLYFSNVPSKSVGEYIALMVWRKIQY